MGTSVDPNAVVIIPPTGGGTPTSATAPAAAPGQVNQTGKSPAVTGSDTSKSAIAKAITQKFLAELGTPKTAADYDVAIERAVAAIAGTNGKADYKKLDAVVLRMPAAERAAFYA